MKSREINYKKFRWFFTSNDLLVIGGKSAEQNEETVPLAEQGDMVLHTKLPGSPFCIIKSQGQKILEKDIKEAAIFCACFSQQWKNKKKTVEIHIFSPEQIFKDKKAKAGTFTVVGKTKNISVKMELYLAIQKGDLRAVPFYDKNQTVLQLTDDYKYTNEKINLKIEEKIKLIPGKISKEETAKKIHILLAKKGLELFTLDQIMQAIPSGGFEEI